MPTMIQMKRQAISDILGVIEDIRYASELSDATVHFSKVMMDSRTALMAPGNVVAFLYLEKYFYRAGGNASLSILITQEEEEQMVTIISPTTRETMILKRADVSFSRKVKNVLLDIGFEVVMEWDEFENGWISADHPEEKNDK